MENALKGRTQQDRGPDMAQHLHANVVNSALDDTAGHVLGACRVFFLSSAVRQE